MSQLPVKATISALASFGGGSDSVMTSPYNHMHRPLMVACVISHSSSMASLPWLLYSLSLITLSVRWRAWESFLPDGHITIGAGKLLLMFNCEPMRRKKSADAFCAHTRHCIRYYWRQHRGGFAEESLSCMKEAQLWWLAEHPDQVTQPPCRMQ